MGFSIIIASQRYAQARAAGMSAVDAYGKYISPLADKDEALWSGLLLRGDPDVQVTRTQNDKFHVTTTIKASGTVVLNRQFRTKSRFARTLETIGVAAIAGTIGWGLGRAAWSLGKAAIGNLAKLNFGTSLLQAGGSAAIATFGPGLTSRMFGPHAELAKRWSGYGLIANTAWNTYNLLPGAQDFGSFVSKYSTIRIARSPTGDEIVKKWIRDNK